MKLRLFWLGFLMLTLVFIFVACSGNGSSDAEGNQSGEEAEANEDKIYDITFMDRAYTIFPPEKGPAVEAIKEKFNANIEAQFILQSDYEDKLSVIMASNDMPDVVSMTVTQNFRQWAKQGAFLPLDDYIDQYETFKMVPDDIWDQVMVDGHIYSIPGYHPRTAFSLTIRKDWLDNLGLDIPTDYEELKEVAIAFTKDDPNGNGKNDTYGFAMGENISPEYHAGAYWSTAWYHENEDGQLIPGIIGPGRKEVIETLAEAYAEGAVTKDFAVLDWAQANKEFYSGKAGIFIGTPSGMVEEYYLGLLEVNPEAEVVSIPYFEAPDGTQGNILGPGVLDMSVLPVRLKDEPDKVEKILEIMDYARTFIPVEERTPENERFDWLFGGEGIGYDVVDGIGVAREGAEDKQPFHYMLQRHEFWKPYAPSDEANKHSITSYNDPKMQDFIATIEEMEKEYNKNPYADPTRGIYSQTEEEKGEELNQYIIGEQTKMISGHRSVSEWDDMVQEWMDRGGADLIKEKNEGLQERETQ